MFYIARTLFWCGNCGVIASLTPRLISQDLNLRSHGCQPTSLTTTHNLGWQIACDFGGWCVRPGSRGCVQCDGVSVAINSMVKIQVE